MSRFFTKSLYIKALLCPTKLYYLSKPDEYDNNSLDDDFLRALARGGFQVGELAKIYFPGGKEVTALRSHDSVPLTLELLKQENVTIFEPAIQFGEFLVRVDILVKTGNDIRIYEVKSGSFDPDEDSFYHKDLLKRGHYQINKEWKDYLYDIAFQTMVCRGALPQARVHPHLMLVDKSQVTSVAGLNQRFLLCKEDGRTRVKVSPGTDLNSVGDRILCALDVGPDVERILEGTDQGAKTRKQKGMSSFADEARHWAKCYREGIKLEPELKKECRKCEFRSQGEKKSGFSECWKPKLKKDPPEGGLVIDLWNFRSTDKLIRDGRLFIHEVTQEDLNIESDSEGGMTNGQRQWIQVEKAAKGDRTPAVDINYLRKAMKAWKFPLHCIDFETTRVAIPFHAGRRPYEQIAFQFSHHIVQEDGAVAHAGEYLHTQRGGFPNFEFVRELKKQLEADDGTIFRYSHFENSVLCDIHEQLRVSSEADKDALMEFIRSITVSSKQWVGPRAMVDLLEIVKKAYYHPLTHGANSLKYVLPAVLHESAWLKKRYGGPVYGSAKGIPSRNFKDHTWIKQDASGGIVDPYQQLQPVFDGVAADVIDKFLTDGEDLKNGGAAMMAFAMMQFTEMTELESQKLGQALLRYCELDTLAMVMLIEHFLEISGQLTFKNAG